VVEENQQLRYAREHTASRRTPGAFLGRQELADLVNEWIYDHRGRVTALDKNYIGKLERGSIRWPDESYRAALRAVLGAANDAQLGFYDTRRMPTDVTAVERQHFLETAARRTDSAPELRVAPHYTAWAVNGAAVAGVVLTHPATAAVDGVAAALTSHDMSSYLNEQVEYAPLAEAAGRTRRNYQAGRYRQVLDELPDLLRGAHVAVNGSLGCDGQRVAADLYQTTCGVLLKCGQGGLAMVAADRSTAAALRSGDPLSMGASARGLAHALADCGHPGRAVSTALAAAQQLEQDGGPSTASALAIFGALLLRAAVLAAGAEDRVTAHGLLNEAQLAAERLDGDDNLYGAYFCTQNLRIHRVSVAIRLGDAGEAIQHARHVDPARIRLGERRASYFLDVARAFTQWGKHREAYDALCVAERAAPQEVALHPASRDLIVKLRKHGPPSLHRPIRQMAHRIGVPS
jgi:hypothetical protein